MLRRLVVFASAGLFLAAVGIFPGVASAQAPAGPLGLFEARQDVGVVLHPGSTEFDPAKKVYTLSGSGENMWAAKDAFQFVWTKASGDLTLAADIEFIGKGTDAHRKACLMIRQGLETDAVYADVAIHGDGLTSLQFREVKGEATHEVQANVTKGPKRVRLEKRGKYIRLFVSGEGSGGSAEELTFSGAAQPMAFEEPFYVGLAVCSHNKDIIEKATFANVELKMNLPPQTGQARLYSTLETQALASTDRRVVHVSSTHFEAPNFLKDGRTLIFNSGGKILKVPLTGGTPGAIDTGFANRCNNDHGVSPDGKTLVISDQSQGTRQSLIYTLPITGGTPKLITQTGPSYWHGWSPDGKTLAYCAERNREYDVYTISVDGGEETRLTTAVGLDDGPEYSPDGKQIYFNSVRSGLMHIWRMNADGSNQEQVTKDDLNNWFPHLSPDGRTMVFLTYEKDVTGHPANKDVMLRRMNLANGRIDILAKLFGGQGTINVPCFSPDGRRIAFVTYQQIAL